MSAFNELVDCPVGCPRCGRAFIGTVYLGFGIRQLDRYKIGDEYRWQENAAPRAGGRPEGRLVAGFGWTACSHCGGDFEVRVLLENDKVLGVEPDLQHLPHSADESFPLEPCPGCGTQEGSRIWCVANYSMARIECTCDVDGFQLWLARPFVRGNPPETIGAPLPWVPSTFHSYD